MVGVPAGKLGVSCKLEAPADKMQAISALLASSAKEAWIQRYREAYVGNQ